MFRYLRVNVLGLALTLNPELRALLLLANGVGLELLAVLLVAQAGSVWLLMRAGAVQARNALGPRLGAGVLELGRWGIGLLGSRASVALPLQMAHALLGARLRQHRAP
jgi:hypothetical protein